MVDNIGTVELLLILFNIILFGVVFFFYVLNTIRRTKKIKKQLKEFFETLENLKKWYIAYSDYEKLLKDYASIKYSVYCSKDYNLYRKIYDNLKENIDKYNEEFIRRSLKEHKEYFDDMYEYAIDEEQRKAILTDDDNNLIIASAGSGKTTTIVGKTKYLLDIKKVNPEEIITISFTNAAKDNFREKLGNDKVKCSTFHKLGLDILSEDGIKPDIAREDFLINTIRVYLNNVLVKEPEKLKRFIKFYAYNLYPDSEKDEKNELIKPENYIYGTLKSKYYSEYNYEKLKTIKDEKVKSKQELIIANFLFLNGINYQYEPKYKYDTATKDNRQYHPDFYLEDYDIYLEHFGINKDNRAPQYSIEVEKAYLEGINWKREIHENFETKLMETYSYEFEKGTKKFEKVLEEKLKKAGVKFKPIDPNEVMDFIMNADNELSYVVFLISKFIRLFKGNNFTVDKFDEFLNDAKEKQAERIISLLEIIKDIFLYYEETLRKGSYVDFDDMINLAAKKVKEHYNHKVSYIIIDEFQDTSLSRYRLVKAIQEKTKAKVIAVGDDWQSIYRFSGCDLALFINFDKYFNHPKYLYINSTYRNCQNLINVSSAFIMKNEKGQLNKSIHSDKKNIDKPVTILYYDKDVSDILALEILRMKSEGCKNITVLGRNNSDIKMFDYYPRPESKFIDMSRKFGEGVIFSTVHKSKGLEYDGVIICNMDDHIAGFPNKMVDDPIIDYVTLNKDDYLYEEERRLFYVALTRTKNRCTLLVPYFNASVFVDEIEKDYADKIELFKPLSDSTLEKIKPQIKELLENNDSDNLFKKNGIEPQNAKRFIDVAFDTGDHSYAYYCPDDFKYKIYDRIKIESNLEIKEVTVVSEPYYSYQHDHDYKMLKIVQENEK